MFDSLDCRLTKRSRFYSFFVGMDATPSTPEPFTFLGTGRGSTKPSLDARVRKYRRNKERAKDSLSAREEILSDRIQRLERSNKVARQERLRLARADRTARNATARNAAAIRRIEYNFESP